MMKLSTLQFLLNTLGNKIMKTVLTQETIQATRQWFADNAQACIDEVKSGTVKVNDPESYYLWQREWAVQALAGAYDHTLAFLQKAHYIQTGECVALLP